MDGSGAAGGCGSGCHGESVRGGRKLLTEGQYSGANADVDDVDKPANRYIR